MFFGLCNLRHFQFAAFKNHGPKYHFMCKIFSKKSTESQKKTQNPRKIQEKSKKNPRKIPEKSQKIPENPRKSQKIPEISRNFKKIR